MSERIRYPDAPGWKGDKATGREAAFIVGQDIGRRHKQVVEAFVTYGASGATCDQISDDLGLPVHIVRPRASELERKGKLFPVGKAPGALGYKVTIYSTIQPEAVAA